MSKTFHITVLNLCADETSVEFLDCTKSSIIALNIFQVVTSKESILLKILAKSKKKK